MITEFYIAVLVQPDFVWEGNPGPGYAFLQVLYAFVGMNSYRVTQFVT